MQCRRPYKVGNYEVGCGRCKACRIVRQESWVCRMSLELLDHPHASFWTLTYKENPGDLDYSHIQKWLKKVRQQHGSFRYFVCGEYGEKLARPHWHVIMFGGPILRDPEKRLWDFGFTVVGPVESGAIRYVAGYVLKKAVKPPLVRMSLKPGLGLERLYALGQMIGAKAKDRPLEKLPSYVTVSNKSYPLYGGGRRAFERGFFKAGGCLMRMAPEELTQIFLRSSAEQRIQWFAEDEGYRFGLHDLDIIERERVEVDVAERRKAVL